MSKKKRGQRERTLAKDEQAVTGEQDSLLLKWGLPALAAMGVFLVYLRTLAPTVGGGDTPELITVAYTMGVAHPPGYPLFTILAKLFTLFPFGTVAWRVNLLSAVCDTAATVIILLAVWRWARNQWAGVLAAGLFAFSPVIWRYAVVGEVFALNNLIVALMLYLAVRYSENGERKLAYLAALVFGLGMSNHHTCLFYGLPIMVWILITGRAQLWTVRRLLMIASGFLAGLLPYVYLPLADLHAAAFSWGNTSTAKGFVNHVLRREYGTFKLGPGASNVRGNFLLGISDYFSALPGETLYIGLFLALFGLYYALRRKSNASLTKLTVAMFGLYVIIFHALANLPLDNPLNLGIEMRFWQQATLMVCVWAGLGFGALASLIPHSRWRNVEMAVLALLIPFAQAAANFRVEDQHLNTAIRDYGREVLRPLPSGSLLWTKGDLMNAVAYVQQCEGYRTDVRAISQEYLSRPWMKRLVNANYPDVSIPLPFYGAGGYDTKKLFDANVSHFKMFIRSHPDLYEADTLWQGDYRFLPFGMVKMIVSNRESVNSHKYIEESEKALPNLDLNMLGRYPDGTWENLVLKDFWTAQINRSGFLITEGAAHGNDREMLEAGAAGLEDFVGRNPNPPAVVFKLLGQAYRKLVVYDPSNLVKMKAAWSRYLELGPQPNDPDLSEIRKAISD